MKKLLAMLLALAMVLSLAACNNAPAEETEAPVVETEAPEAPATYTYNYSMSEFPTNWNYHTYQTNTDAEILDYITAGFYTFDYNETLDGYAMVPGMAVGEPVDVTADYIGQYGIEEGAEARAYVINLREDLFWENGEQITAHDFVESAKRLLDPAAQNYRADTMYAGSVIIHNAEAYMKQGQTVKQDNSATGAYALADLVKGEDGAYTTPAGGKVYIAVAYPISWTSGNSLADYVNAYGDAYFGMDTWEALAALADEEA